jgi:hypothetical protein
LPGNKLTTALQYEVAQILEKKMKIAGFEWDFDIWLIKIEWWREYVTEFAFPKSKVGFYMKEVMQCQILKEAHKAQRKYWKDHVEK